MKMKVHKWASWQQVNSWIILFIIFAIMSSNLGLTSVSFSSPASLQNQPRGPQKKSPEERRELQKLAERVFQSAKKLFTAGEYWKTTQELIVLIDYYPQFAKIDQVYYYVAESLRELEMSKPAIQTYKWLLLKSPQSNFTPHALLGLQKVAFQKKEYKKSYNYYYTILKKYSESSVLNAARYYAGQSLYYLKKWDQAILLLKRINKKSDYFDHALYTISLAMLKKKEFTRRWNT